MLVLLKLQDALPSLYLQERLLCHCKDGPIETRTGSGVPQLKLTPSA